MSEIIKILDSRFVTDRDIRVTKALVSSVEYSELKQRITELEQQLKTAKSDGVREFSSSLSKEYLTKGINNKFEGFSVSQHIEAQAKVFANNLEGK